MSSRKCEITHCGHCRYFNNEYWTYEAICIKLDRRIESNPKEDGDYPIPDDCPLEKWDGAQP